jgi:hypothetical protein
MMVFDAADRVCTLSDREQEEISRLMPDLPVVVASFVQECAPRPTAFSERRDIRFIGGSAPLRTPMQCSSLSER